MATESGDSIKMYERIRDLSSVPYKAIFVPEDNVANTILINGKVICKSRKENPRSFAVLQRECPHELVEIESSEIEKAVGSLTCLSLRFNRPRRVGTVPAPPPLAATVSSNKDVTNQTAAALKAMMLSKHIGSAPVKAPERPAANGGGRLIMSVGSTGSFSASSDDEGR